MKNLLNAFVIGGTMLAATVSFAQTPAATKEEAHAKLTSHHTKAKENAHKIASGEALTKESRTKHAAEAGKSLEGAKAAHQELKKTIPAKYQEVAKPHHAAIEKHHAEAKTHHDNLTAELKKEKPDHAKVKEHAKALHTSLDNAEKEHQTLKAKTTAK